MSYTHLQVRSGYSLMSSTITVDKLVGKAQALQFDALALTDEHVLYGVIPFYNACQRKGIKPIIGMSVHVIDANQDPAPCVLLAKNNHGYHALVKMSTDIQVHKKSGMELDDLHVYADNLICILPAASSKVKTMLRSETHDKVASYLTTWQDVFSVNDFYLGIQDSNPEVHQALKAFHNKYKTPVVAISDVRYLDEKDDIALDVLQAMKKGNQWGMKLSDSSIKGKHLRSELEIEQSFSSFWPEVIEETEVIKDKCTVIFDFDKRLLPSFPVPNQISAHEYLENLCWINVKQKYELVTERIQERLRYELEIIKSMYFSDYFLIVSDFISFAKENDILVGPGRGSSAGSIVAYVLGITDVDPIQYNLLFERFLNPERLTMPDIDVDFSDARRDEVIEYVRQKYGVQHVAQIITFGTFAARSLIRELIKTMDIDQQDANFILKEIPLQSGKNVGQIVKESEDLKQYIKQSKKLKILFAIAVKLEGIPRHISTHAAGVVISEKPLIEHVPLTVGANETLLTQYPMNELEAVGLLKMDFLGLRNLTLLEKVIQSIKYTTNKSMTLDAIPENDEKTYALLRSGKTNGVFQLESQGMKQVLTELLPSSFEDIVAVNALFRPGPMDFIPIYIARKHKRERVTYPHPDLKPILEKTYGVLVYQEQIMQIASRIAGFTLGEADILRRAVSKKKQDVMDEQKEAFINGCLANGYEKNIAEEIFGWIVKFSNYGFPRSHAVAYSKISYQLAFLKAHYPANFFAEVLSSVRNQQEKLNLYMKEIKELGLHLLPPTINESYGKYTVEKANIRMGLSSVKGVGNQAINEVIGKRKDGPFKNLFDFCLRVSLKLINRQTIENLIIAGVFDATYSNRASLLASVDQAIEQGELFGGFSGGSTLFQEKIELEAGYVVIEDFSLVKRLADEKELLGMYVSSHPLKEYRQRLRSSGYISLTDALHLSGRRNIKSVAIIQSIKTIRTKRGDPMAFITLGDENGEMDAVIFPDLYRNSGRLLKEEMIVQISGKIESRNNRLQWILDSISSFDANVLPSPPSERLFIKSTKETRESALNRIKEITKLYPGNIPIIIYDEEKKQTYQLTEDYYINPVGECLQALYSYFGKENVVIRKNVKDGK